MPRALLCPRCGAPLPAAAATLPHSACAYCGATLRQDHGALHVAARAAPAQSDLEDQARRRQAFLEALKSVSLASADPYTVLCDAARTHLGALGESDAIARVTLGLAAHFEAESGARVMRDPMVLARLAEAYLRASAELRDAERTTLNLPFLSVTSAGPVHYQRELTVHDLAALASADLRAPAAPEASPAAGAPAKRGWWPFG